MMQKYFNRNGNSNVECYEIGDTYIDVCFFGPQKRIDNGTSISKLVRVMSLDFFA